MSYAYEPIAIRAGESERAAFIRRTYGHLAGAIFAFILLEWALLSLPNIERIVIGMAGNWVTWIAILVGFIGVSYLADRWAHSEISPGVQYLGLGLYVVAEAVIFLPLLYVAKFVSKDPTLISQAGILTLAAFGGLTFTAFTTRKDFSFLRPIVSIGSLLVFGVAICFVFIGGFTVTLGLILSFVMVALASASILYQTSNIIHHYRTDQHVAASLGLFASVALLFYHILLILLESQRE